MVSGVIPKGVETFESDLRELVVSEEQGYAGKV